MTGTPFFKALGALTWRWFRRLRREPAGLVSTLAQPALWLVLFGNLFEGSQIVSDYSYIAFMSAGVIVMTVFNATISGGVEILFDRESGVLQRLFATPIPPVTIFASRFLFVNTLATVQALIILLTAFLLGVPLTANVLGLALILLTGVLLGMGITAISVTLALVLRGHGQFFSIIGFVSLPLTFVSNALVPLETMPQWMQIFSRINPLTYAITIIRSLILEGVDWGLIAQMGGVLLVFGIVMVGMTLWVSGRVTE